PGDDVVGGSGWAADEVSERIVELKVCELLPGLDDRRALQDDGKDLRWQLVGSCLALECSPHLLADLRRLLGVARPEEEEYVACIDRPLEFERPDFTRP